jgi:hypothetical protein
LVESIEQNIKFVKSKIKDIKIYGLAVRPDFSCARMSRSFVALGYWSRAARRASGSRLERAQRAIVGGQGRPPHSKNIGQNLAEVERSGRW